MLPQPDKNRLENLNETKIGDFPRFARARRRVDHPAVSNIEGRTKSALAAIDIPSKLDDEAEVGIAAGSRGIANTDEILRTTVDWVKEQGLKPFIIPAMGSHGGATEDGQKTVLSKLGITQESMECEIRGSMSVKQIDESENGHPIFFSEEALSTDAILLMNRIKIHTDFVDGTVESGLCKMGVIGLGKQRGAESAHNAAMVTSFREVLPKWGARVIERTPIIGGLAILENGHDETAAIEGIPADSILDREKQLFKQSLNLFPTLPVDDLDLLIVDEIGKHISGTGMDTNVVGRMLIHGEPEPESPTITRIYARSLTGRTDGNGLGIGLADFIHENIVRELDVTETYINAITGSEPERARIPITLPSDKSALIASYSTTGAKSPEQMRIARINNTMEPNNLYISEPVVDDLRNQDNITIEHLNSVAFEDGMFATGFDN